MAESNAAPAASPAAPTSPGARLRKAWTTLAPWPGGKWLFSRMVDWMAPYTGSIRARVEGLSAGYCRNSLRERRALRNPFNSVHAVALMNLAEEASGLATLYALPDGVRGIVTGLAIEYKKKARGKITAECRTVPPTDVPPGEPLPHTAEITLTDESGDVVAQAQATWTLSRLN
jgi:acyl-coenzyme A thioesterase PaaI-like protein